MTYASPSEPLPPTIGASATDGRAMSDDYITGEQVLGWLTNEGSRDVEDYVKRGRQFKEKEIGFLKERWIELYLEMFNFDNTNGQERNDINAEIELRGEEPPYLTITKELEAYTEKAASEMDRLKKEEPDRYADINRDLDIKVANFLNQLKKPN